MIRKCFIIGMILSLSLQAKAFIPTNNTAVCAAASYATVNKEREREEDKEPGILTTAFGVFVVMYLIGKTGLFSEKDNDI